MPQVHLYIRNEDLSKWQVIENKSEFVHDALRGHGSFVKRVEEIRAELQAEEPEEEYTDENWLYNPRDGRIYDKSSESLADLSGYNKKQLVKIIQTLKDRGRVR